MKSLLFLMKCLCGWVGDEREELTIWHYVVGLIEVFFLFGVYYALTPILKAMGILVPLKKALGKATIEICMLCFIIMLIVLIIFVEFCYNLIRRIIKKLKKS